MEAAQRGAKILCGLEIGCTIALYREQAANARLDRHTYFDSIFALAVLDPALNAASPRALLMT